MDEKYERKEREKWGGSVGGERRERGTIIQQWFLSLDLKIRTDSISMKIRKKRRECFLN